MGICFTNAYGHFGGVDLPPPMVKLTFLAALAALYLPY